MDTVWRFFFLIFVVNLRTGIFSLFLEWFMNAICTLVYFCEVKKHMATISWFSCKQYIHKVKHASLLFCVISMLVDVIRYYYDSTINFFMILRKNLWNKETLFSKNGWFDVGLIWYLTFLSFSPQFLFLSVKFIYSEKATKFCEMFTLLLFYVVPVKSKVTISQNFVAFSEYIYTLYS